MADLIETLNPDVLNLLEVTSKRSGRPIVDVLHEKGLTEYRGYHIDSNDTFTRARRGRDHEDTSPT